MRDILLAIFGTLFVWWASTGSIIFLAGLPSRTFKWTLSAATLVLLLSCAGLVLTRNDTSVAGALLAFFCGICAWSWLEVTYYTGAVTGLKIAPCNEGCSGWRHFGHAIQANLWHELAALSIGALTIALTWDAPNPFGRWSFLLLLWMHGSARLNMFLGAPNLFEEALPAQLQHMRRFLTRKPMNLFFPFAVTACTVMAVVLFAQAFAPGAPAYWQAGCIALAVLMSLAVLEHWLLVIPISSNALWQWGLKSRQRGSAGTPSPQPQPALATTTEPAHRLHITPAQENKP